ncbi:MAG: hypothetical protein JNJ83_14080 [Verrucomicrobiaceae bacterium]|nr:hypothetical protein [Verrucomicrobiaceae bacterium]
MEGLRADDAAASLLSSDTKDDLTGLDNLGVEAPSSAADDDIGLQLILRKHEKSRHFRATAHTSGFWTSNAANVNAGAVEDYFMVGGVNLAWQQRLKGRFIGDVQAGLSSFRYDKLDILNYEYWEGTAGLIIQMPELWDTLLYVQYGYQRITQDLDSDALYESHSARLGAYRAFTINRLNSIHVSLQSQLSFAAEPEFLQRHEHWAQLGYSLRLSRTLALLTTYRTVFYDYFNFEGRQDWYHNAGVALNWRPKEWLEMSAGYNFTFNSSNVDVFDYETHLAGPSIALRVRF